MNINDLLKIAVERKASDLHLKVGSHPVIRIDGELIPLGELKRLMQEDTIAMAFSIMNARQKQRFKEELELDIAYSVPGLASRRRWRRWSITSIRRAPSTSSPSRTPSSSCTATRNRSSTSARSTSTLAASPAP